MLPGVSLAVHPRRGEMRPGLRVGLVHNMKDDVAVAADAPSAPLAECHSVETTRALEDALLTRGDRIVCLGGNEALLDDVHQTALDVCFDIAEGLRGDARDEPGDRWFRPFLGCDASSCCLTALSARAGLR
jgi:hypothetical protein